MHKNNNIALFRGLSSYMKSLYLAPKEISSTSGSETLTLKHIFVSQLSLLKC